MKHSGYFVNIYLADVAYGGPEEGGWWYPVGEAVRSFAFHTRKKAERCKRLVERAIDKANESRPSISSVLSQGQFRIALEKHPAQDFPQVRPHYE